MLLGREEMDRGPEHELHVRMCPDDGNISYYTSHDILMPFV